MSNLPTLTDEQRRVAVEHAVIARRERANLKHELKSHQLSIGDALDDPRAQRLRVCQLLKSLPGIGEKRAGEIMCRLDIAPNRRVHGLGPHQRERLAAFFSDRDM